METQTDYEYHVHCDIEPAPIKVIAMTDTLSLILSNARFMLCSRRPWQPRFRPPWTKRDRHETMRRGRM